MNGLARLEIGRDRPPDPQPDIARVPQRIAQSDSDRWENHREDSRRQMLAGSFSPINDDRNSRPVLSLRNTVQGDSNPANNRRQILPSSLAPFANDDGNRQSSSSRFHFDADDYETGAGDAEVPGPPTRRATEPPPLS